MNEKKGEERRKEMEIEGKPNKMVMEEWMNEKKEKKEGRKWK